MKALTTFLVLAALGLLLSTAQIIAAAPLEIVAPVEPQRIFSGACAIEVTWRNLSDQAVAMPVRLRLYQVSSDTAMPVGEIQDWKQLQVLPHQTILETASLAIPSVKAETRFVVRWLDETNRVLGHTEAVVYPTNLLSHLRPLGGAKAIGVFDPQNLLKPLLRSAAVGFEDLEANGLQGFSGKLAIIESSPAALSGSFPGSIADLAKRGVAVVWILPGSKSVEELQPSYYLVPKGKGTVLVAETSLADNLAANPRSQLNLIQLCRRALRPEPWEMPMAGNRTEP